MKIFLFRAKALAFPCHKGRVINITDDAVILMSFLTSLEYHPNKTIPPPKTEAHS